MSLQIQSRIGSAVVGIIGLAFTIASLILLVLTVSATWDLARTMDFLIYLSLVIAAAIGIWFMAIAAFSFGLRLDGPLLKRHAPGHSGHAM